VVTASKKNRRTTRPPHDVPTGESGGEKDRKCPSLSVQSSKEGKSRKESRTLYLNRVTAEGKGSSNLGETPSLKKHHQIRCWQRGRQEKNQKRKPRAWKRGKTGKPLELDESRWEKKGHTHVAEAFSNRESGRARNPGKKTTKKKKRSIRLQGGKDQGGDGKWMRGIGQGKDSKKLGVKMSEGAIARKKDGALESPAANTAKKQVFSPRSCYKIKRCPRKFSNGRREPILDVF